MERRCEGQWLHGSRGANRPSLYAPVDKAVALEQDWEEDPGNNRPILSWTHDRVNVGELEIRGNYRNPETKVREPMTGDGEFVLWGRKDSGGGRVVTAVCMFAPMLGMHA